MKIKCTDSVKKGIPSQIINECIMMSNLFYPNERIHIFGFQGDKGTLSIRHIIPSLKTQYELLYNQSVPIYTMENIIIIRIKENIFILVESEMHLLLKDKGI